MKNNQVMMSQEELQALIATAVSTALSQQSKSLATSARVKSPAPMAQARVPQAKTVKRPAVQVPAKPAPVAKAKPQAQSMDDGDTIVLTVPTDTTDKRVKLPRRMFLENRFQTAHVDGVKYSIGTDADGGRVKVQPEIFSAGRGQIITLTRIQGQRWESSVSGKAQGQAVKSQAQPKAAPVAAVKKAAQVPQAAKRAVKPQAQAVKSPARRIDMQAVSQIIKTTAEKALRGHAKGIENTNLPEGDARRFLSSRDKKEFNKTTNALGLKLEVAVEMLNDAVFEG